MSNLYKYSGTQVLSLLTVLFLSIPFSASNAQIFESFENGVKTGYASGTVDLATGTWLFEEALIGSADNDVKKSGSNSVRMGAVGAKLQMQFNKDGVGEVSFWHSISNFSGDKTRDPAVMQLRKSTNGGVSWVNVGEPFPATTEMIQTTFQINQPGNHRFEIQVVVGSPVGTRNRRVNIDDFRITNYIQVSESPTISAEVNGAAVTNAGTFAFNSTAVGQTRSASLLIRNTGSQTLTLTGSSFASGGFSLASSLAGVNISSLGIHEVNITFTPTVLQTYNDVITIQSNDPVNPSFTINLEGSTFDASTPITLAEARALPLGTNVTVSGWITVGNELGGPAYFQDATGGLASFWPALHAAVQMGDSVVITGPLGEFGNTPGSAGDGLRQISVASGSTDEILFTVHPSGRKVQAPKVVTISQLNSGIVEAQLIALENVSIVTIENFIPSNTPFVGSFQANTNYGLKDANGNSALLRIDNDTDLVGAAAPSGPITIVGVVGRFRGDYQILPRSSADLDAEIFDIPFENISKTRTFEAVTWNIEWFGSAGNGPTNVELQLTNVIRVMRTIDADLYALQEISNETMFRRLVDSLDGYRGFIAPYSQSQKTAFVYKTETVDSLLAGFATQDGSWGGGRWPYYFLFNANVDGVVQRIRAITIHAKAFATQSDYNERLADSEVLKSYMDLLGTQNVLLLGDFNDDVTTSTFNNLTSPYQNFVQDANYKMITKSLSDRGQTSYSSFSNIDHIVANVRMKTLHMEGTERIENPSYVGNYLSTTSDHFPVWTRFAFTDVVSVEDKWDGDVNAASFRLEANYPNPFNPNTVIGYSIGTQNLASVQVRLTVYDVLGREVAVLVNGVQAAGFHEVRFDAGNLSSGLYIYRLETPQGSVSRTMMLMK